MILSFWTVVVKWVKERSMSEDSSWCRKFKVSRLNLCWPSRSTLCWSHQWPGSRYPLSRTSESPSAVWLFQGDSYELSFKSLPIIFCILLGCLIKISLGSCVSISQDIFSEKSSWKPPMTIWLRAAPIIRKPLIFWCVFSYWNSLTSFIVNFSRQNEKKNEKLWFGWKTSFRNVR